MRELSLNGYIDDEMWFGDEITPESLHEALYGKENRLADDVHIRQAMYDADFWMLEESDKGYNQPAYDPATRTYTVQWTWVYWQDAMG